MDIWNQFSWYGFKYVKQYKTFKYCKYLKYVKHPKYLKSLETVEEYKFGICVIFVIVETYNKFQTCETLEYF